ncbi:MAG: AAA family ATPase, partial [Verrucomicrobiota bacterium]
PREFSILKPEMFSLGQEDKYYENLSRLDGLLRVQVLTSMGDIAHDDKLWLKVRDEDVTKESLLRYVTVPMLVGQFRRMAHGGARLTPFNFSFQQSEEAVEGKSPIVLDFFVTPEGNPPTNIHVIIGRNGVGKSRLLGLMRNALIAPGPLAHKSGEFIWKTLEGFTFANLVEVSFSAFDNSDLPVVATTPDRGLNYTYVGLRSSSGSARGRLGEPKSHGMLASEFVESLSVCQVEPRRQRWIRAVSILQGDPVFKFAGVADWIEPKLTDDVAQDKMQKLFSRLSSGHQIVLLTLTKLVETVEERTLFLIDEPEAHLHPPLLSGFVRALSDLLVDRNGVAIMATHSPVLLQEVPKACVWILRRVCKESKAERPSIETFGENVGILSREVFQLELVQSGFHKLLEDAARTSATYRQAVDKFDGQLGSEARAVLRAILLEKNPQPDCS